MNKQIYLAPIAEMVIVDGTSDVLDSDTKVFSVVEGSLDDVTKAKSDYVSYKSEIWDDPE